MTDDSCFQTAQLLLQHSHNDTDIIQQESRTKLLSVHLEANPILSPGKHQHFTSIFKEKISAREIVNNYTRGGQLPKLNTTLSPESNKGSKVITTHRKNWRYSVQRRFGETNTQSKTFTSTNLKDPDLKPPSPQQQDYADPSQLQDFIRNSPHEFQYIMKKSNKLLYLRFNNSRLNYFNKSGKRYYSSLFFDCKAFVNEKRQKKPFDLYQYFNKKFPTLPPQIQENQNLQFDSNFECGNLFSVHKISDRQYNIFMQNDTNTKGSTQWFYFSVTNCHRTKVRLNVVNFYKESSLYEKGMKPIIYSTQRAKNHKDQNWRRTGQSVTYEQSLCLDGINYYQLSFTYDFEYLEDKVYIAYSLPYSYSDMRRYLDRLVECSGISKFFRRSILCRTVLNHNIYLLEITNNKEKKNIKKEIVYVLGRQHAGQTPGSFVMQGLINTLLSNRLESCELRDRYIFKIVPMVNPDGVVVGNYRTNLSGNDVNRKWDFPNKNIHPQIFYIKEKITEDKKDVKFFLDLHAHSRKMNSFFYGSPMDKEEHKLYPFVCSRLNKDISFQQCSYFQDQSKRSTARIVSQIDLGVRKCYTFETSFYGRYRDGSRQHFQKNDLRALGEALVLGLYYSELKLKQQPEASRLVPQETMTIIPKNIDVAKSNDPNFSGYKEVNSDGAKTVIEHPTIKSKTQHTIEMITRELQQKWKKELAKASKNEQDDSGSDSQPEQFLLKEIEIEEFSHLKEYEDLLKFNQQNSPNAYHDDQQQDFDKVIKDSHNNRETSSPISPIHKKTNPNPNSNAIVKLLESEMHHMKHRNRQMQQQRLKQAGTQRIYMSLDQDNKKPRGYRQNITQLKRTLKFMIDDKGDAKNSLYNRYMSSMGEYKQSKDDIGEQSKPLNQSRGQKNMMSLLGSYERKI